jgi:hypothetical protein
MINLNLTGLKILKAQNSRSQATCLGKTTHGLKLRKETISHEFILVEEPSPHGLNLRKELNVIGST